MSESELLGELSKIDATLRARLAAAGVDAARLVTLAAPLFARACGEATLDRDERNRIRGVVEPPRPEDVLDVPAPGSPEHARLAAVGAAAIRRGEVAFCVMAGGMATRMGGVVKALVDAFDGRTFLELRLHENATWSRRAGAPVPLWLMTSEATEGPTREALARAKAPAHVATFTQDLGLRLTKEGALFVGDDGQPSTYAPGHGDLPDALRRSGLLSSFVARGGKFVWIANLDNLGASIDEALLGLFIEQSADVLVEVAPKAEGDRGGIPVWADSEDHRGPRRSPPAGARGVPTSPGLRRQRGARLQYEHAPGAGGASPEDQGELRLVRGREEGRRPGGRAVRAPLARAHRGDAGRVRACPTRGKRLAIPSGEGLRRAGQAPGTTSGRSRRPERMMQGIFPLSATRTRRGLVC